MPKRGATRGTTREYREERDKKIVELWKKGLNSTQISARMGITTSTIFTILKKYKDANPTT